MMGPRHSSQLSSYFWSATLGRLSPSAMAVEKLFEKKFSAEWTLDKLMAPVEKDRPQFSRNA